MSSSSRVFDAPKFIMGTLEALGHKPNPQGMCSGISGAYIEDAVLGERSNFVKKLDVISSREKLVEDLKVFPLTEELNEISTFFEMIQKYHEVCNGLGLHVDARGMKLHRHDFETLSKISGSKKIREKGGLARVFFDENILTPVKFVGIFKSYVRFFKKSVVKQKIRLLIYPYYST